MYCIQMYSINFSSQIAFLFVFVAKVFITFYALVKIVSSYLRNDFVTVCVTICVTILSSFFHIFNFTNTGNRLGHIHFLYHPGSDKIFVQILQYHVFQTILNSFQGLGMGQNVPNWSAKEKKTLNGLFAKGKKSRIYPFCTVWKMHDFLSLRGYMKSIFWNSKGPK